MGRRKKKSVAQLTAGLATSWMPRPLADFFATPFGALVFMVAAPILLATGVITVTWNNGLPSISVNRQQAVVVAQQLEQQVQEEARRRSPQPWSQQGPEQQHSAQQFQPAYR